MKPPLILSLMSLVPLLHAQDSAGIDASNQKGRPYSPYADRAFPTDVYFGDTHVHTGLSADAGGGGTRLMPREAYRFARGEQVTSNTGQPVKETQSTLRLLHDHRSLGCDGRDHRHHQGIAQHRRH